MRVELQALLNAVQALPPEVLHGVLPSVRAELERATQDAQRALDATAPFTYGGVLYARRPIRDVVK